MPGSFGKRGRGAASIPWICETIRFHHVSFTRDGDQFRLVVDGEEITARASLGPTDNLAPVSVGHRYPDLTHLFRGQIGAVRLGADALSADQIADRAAADMQVIAGEYFLDQPTVFEEPRIAFPLVAHRDNLSSLASSDFSLSIPVTAPTFQSDTAGISNVLVEKLGLNIIHPFSCRVYNDRVPVTNGHVVCTQFAGGSALVLTSRTRINDGEPHHVVLRQVAGVLELWIDGAPERIETSLGGGDNTEPVSIGHQAGDAVFEGRLGRIAFWNRAITPEEMIAAGAFGNR